MSDITSEDARVRRKQAELARRLAVAKERKDAGAPNAPACICQCHAIGDSMTGYQCVMCNCVAPANDFVGDIGVRCRDEPRATEGNQRHGRDHGRIRAQRTAREPGTRGAALADGAPYVPDGRFPDRREGAAMAFEWIFANTRPRRGKQMAADSAQNQAERR